MSTILVVDDMAVVREPIAASLRLAGYQTVLASNGLEAIDLATADPPDLILLDLSMPGMDGLDFLREQQKHPALRDVPVILLTAVTDKRSIVEVANLGVKDYLLKSQFSMDELVARVGRRLEESDGHEPHGRSDKGPLKGLKKLDPDMTVSEIADHIKQSPELDSPLSDPTGQSGPG